MYSTHNRIYHHGVWLAHSRALPQCVYHRSSATLAGVWHGIELPTICPVHSGNPPGSILLYLTHCENFLESIRAIREKI